MRMLAGVGHPGRQGVPGRQAEDRGVDEIRVLPPKYDQVVVIEWPQADHVCISPDAATRVQQPIAEPIGERTERPGAAVAEHGAARQHLRRINEFDTLWQIAQVLVSV